MQSLSSRLARGALDAAPDAMIIIDGAGTILFANRQVAAVFGYPPDQIIGKPVESLMPERFRRHHPSLRHAYVESVRFRPMGAGSSLFRLRSDGSEFPVEISLSPVNDAGRTLVSAAIRDVTERKRIEAMLYVQVEEMQRLHAMSTRLVEAADLPKMLEEVLEATIALQRADFGNIQLHAPETGELKIVAQRGFSRTFLEHFAVVDSGDDSACGRALREGGRIIIEDVDDDDGHLPHRAEAAREGYRAVQSTPIRGRDGAAMGMLSSSAVKEVRDPLVAIVSKPVDADHLLAMIPELISS